MKETSTDVLIIGAGPAGTSAGAILRQHSISATILERSVFPRFVIGESLLPRCMDHLDTIGALDLVENAGFQYKNGARFIKEGQFYDIDFAEKSTDGYAHTYQVKRAKFDTLLADHVVRKGVPVEFNATVEAVSFDEDMPLTTYRKGGRSFAIRSRFIIDASGYGRVLPRLLHLDKQSSLETRSAFFTHIRSKELWNNIDPHKVNYFIGPDDIYVWVIPFADEAVSVGLVGDSHLFPTLADTVSFENLINGIHDLKDICNDLEYLMEPRLISGFSKSVSKYYGDNYLMAGNATEFLDPIFSSGVTIAMESGILGATLAARQLKGGSVDWENEYEGYLKKGVEVFKHFVQSWYSGDLIKVFFAEEKSASIQRYICSILAGYVWDEKNPFVRKPERGLNIMTKLV